MVVTFGLTPAVQRVMVFGGKGGVELGRVNRAGGTFVCAAGKAVNAARAARIWLGEGAEVVAVAPLGGGAGRWCVEELGRVGVRWVGVDPGFEVRTCVTVVESDVEGAGRVTELVEESGGLGGEAGGVVERLVEGVDGRGAVEGAGGVLACCGSIGVGVSGEVYARVAKRWAETGGKAVLVDGKGEVLLKALGVGDVAVRVAKLNAEELLETVGVGGREGVAALHRAGATHVVVTDGAGAVVGSDGREAREFVPPKVRVVNTTGCGDCLAGVMAAELSVGGGFWRALEVGVKASARSAEEILPAVFRKW